MYLRINLKEKMEEASLVDSVTSWLMVNRIVAYNIWAYPISKLLIQN